MSELAPSYPRSAFWGCLVLVGILLAVIHWPALNAEIRQSELQIFQNPLVVGVGMGSSPASPFTAQIGATGLASYLPLTTVSYRISYFIGGVDPLVHRAVNLLIVFLTAVLLFQLLWRLTRDTAVSVAAVILYLVHPVASAVPSMVAGREELLLVLFLVWGWKLHLESQRDESGSCDRHKLIYACLAYLAALLSSEKAVLFLGLVLIGDITIRTAANAASSADLPARPARRRPYPAYVAFLGITAVFFVWKYWVIGVRPWSIVGRVETLDNPLVYQSLLSSLGNALKLAGVYLSKSLWQVPPMGDFYDYIPLASPADLTLWTFVAFALLIGTLAFLKFRQMPMAFMPAWIFGLGILPALNLFYTTPDAVADQHIYFPAIGVALAIALLARYLRSGRHLNRKLLLGVGVVVVLLLGVIATVHSFRLASERGWMLAMQSFEPYNIKLASRLAQDLRGTDLMPQAVKSMEEIVRIHPDSVQARVELGRIRALSGDLASASKALSEAKGLDAANPEPYIVQGNIYEGAGQPAAAIHEYESALKIQPKHARALGLLAVAHQGSREITQAMECYRKALEINPGSASSYINMGGTLAQEDKYQEALHYYQLGLQLDPTLAEGHLNLGNAYLRLGRGDEAEATFDSAIQLFRDNPAVMVRAGLIYQQMRNYDKAAAVYQSALSKNPKDIGLLLALGNTYRFAGEVPQALEQYNKALAINPKSVDAYMGIGNTHSAAGNVAQALEAFGKAAEVAPENPLVHFNIGNTLRGAGRNEAAEAAYLKALQLQPDYSQACYNLAVTYESMNRPADAIQYYQAFLKYWQGEPAAADSAKAHIQELLKKTAKP